VAAERVGDAEDADDVVEDGEDDGLDDRLAEGLADGAVEVLDVLDDGRADAVGLESSQPVTDGDGGFGSVTAPRPGRTRKKIAAATTATTTSTPVIRMAIRRPRPAGAGSWPAASSGSSCGFSTDSAAQRRPSQ
jgi:hypothetical protein